MQKLLVEEKQVKQLLGYLRNDMMYAFVWSYRIAENFHRCKFSQKCQMPLV